MRAEPDQTQSDRDLPADRRLPQRLRDHYDRLAATDPTAYHLDPADLPGDIVTYVRTGIAAHRRGQAFSLDGW